MNFSVKIINWYNLNKRDLPWRKTSDPYKIWLSEIILQQTRIDQGSDYYLRFVKKFPDLNSLANADENQVLKLWQGLGYYTRARNLHKTAREILTNREGIFPDSYEEIITLPGIGEYTSAAILSIAYGRSYPVIDGNVSRVISRFAGVEHAIDSREGKKIIQKKAWEYLWKEDPGTYNQAIMEFGALFCKPKNPNCEECIFSVDCVAYKKGIVNKIPLKKPRQVQRTRYFYYFLFCFQGNDSPQILINKRGGNDIWKNLYDFPLIESDKPLSLKKINEMKIGNFSMKNKGLKTMGNEYKHILSHQVIMAKFIRVVIKEVKLAEIQKNIRNEKLIPIDTKDLIRFPVPRLIDKFLKENPFDDSSEG